MLNHAETHGPTGTAGRGRRGREGPPPVPRRWTARRKAEVAAAVAVGRLTVAAACRTYGLSEEELAAWRRALDRHGVEGLKVGRLRECRFGPAPAAAFARGPGRRPSDGAGLPSAA